MNPTRRSTVRQHGPHLSAHREINCPPTRRSRCPLTPSPIATALLLNPDTNQAGWARDLRLDARGRLVLNQIALAEGVRMSNSGPVVRMGGIAHA